MKLTHILNIEAINGLRQNRFIGFFFIICLLIGYSFTVTNTVLDRTDNGSGNYYSVLDVVSNLSSGGQLRIEVALKGPMADKADDSQKSIIIKWAKSGANEQDYIENISPIIKNNCLSCHSGSDSRVPNLDGYSNLLYYSTINTKNSSQSLFSNIQVYQLNFIALIVSFLFIILFYLFYVEKINHRSFLKKVLAVSFVGFLISLLPTGSTFGTSVVVIVSTVATLSAFVFFIAMRFLKLFLISTSRSFAPNTARTPVFLNFIGRHLFALLTGLAIFVVGASGAAYFSYKYIQSHGFCLGVMCHYTGEISEFEKSYWQVESAEARAQLPKYKTLPAISESKLTPSALGKSEERFKTWGKVYGDSQGTKFSSLTDINTTNVKDLEVAWEYRADADNLVRLQSTPLIIGNILYSPTAAGNYVALNAKTGHEIWKFTPHSGAPGLRGITWWKDPKTSDERLFFIAGGKLHSLDAKTGKLNKDFGSRGTVKTGQSHPAPVTTGDLVIIATFNAKIQAFDIRSGSEVWTFETRKEKPDLHRGGGEHYLVGSNVWGGMALDAERGLLYASVGNPRQPNYGALRPGPNLYSNSVVAIDVKSGKISWHFQETAHDLWDLDVVSPPVLTTINRQNGRYDVVAVTTKSGNTLLLDRVSGGLIYDYRMRRAPTSKIPGEHTSPYQPDVELPQPFSTTLFGPDDVTDIGEANTANILKQIGDAKMGFYEPPILNGKIALFGMIGGASWPGSASNPYEGILYIPSYRHPWMITLFYRAVDESGFPSSASNDLYQEKCAHCHGVNREGDITTNPIVPTLTGTTIQNDEFTFTKIFKADHPDFQKKFSLEQGDISSLYKHFNLYDRLAEKSRKSGAKFQHAWIELRDDEGHPGSNLPWGRLTALDLNTGLIKWQVPFGNYEDVILKSGKETGQPNAGGAIVTAGELVFATGTVDGKVRAFNKENGDLLWSYQLPFSGSAPPATFAIDGEQYVVVQATGRDGSYFKGLGNAMVAFKIKK